MRNIFKGHLYGYQSYLRTTILMKNNNMNNIKYFSEFKSFHINTKKVFYYFTKVVHLYYLL